MAIPQTADEARAQDDAFSKQWDAEQEAKKAQETTPPIEQQHPLTAFANWATSLSGKVSTSILDTALHGAAALVNTSADVVGKVSPTAARFERNVASGIAQVPLNVAESVRAPLVAAARQLPGGTPQEADTMEPVFAHAHAAMQDFTDAVKVKDPGLIDNATQLLAQTVPVYIAAGKGVADLAWRAKNVVAGAISDYSLPPGTPRLADTLSLLRQTDNKYIAALQAADPTGGRIVNGYINFLMHKGPESDAEAHFKNMLDGVIPNFVGGEALHAIGVTLKQGNRVVRTAVNNGIGSLGDLGPPAGSRAAQRGGPAAAVRAPLQQGADPAERIIEEQAARDADAAANAPTGAKRAPLVQGDNSNLESLMDNAPSELEKDRVLTHEREQAKNPDGGFTTTGNVHDYVTGLATDMDGSTEEGAFYKDLFGRLSAKKLDTQFVPPGTGLHTPLGEDKGLLGQHNLATNTTALYPKAYQNNATYVHTIAHEGVHAATVKALASQPDTRVAIAELMDRADTSYQAAELKAQDRYGIRDKDPKEFVAEAEANPQFQRMLKSVNSADGRSLWDHYKEIIGGIFGLSGATITSPLWDKVLTRKQEKSGA